MTKMKRTIISFMVAVVFVSLIKIVSAANCGGAVQCNCGDTLIESQTMWYDLSCGRYYDGLIIGSDNISLDCNGHSISGGVYGNYGIYLNKNNVTIKNCSVQTFNQGILVSGSSNIIIGNIASWNWNMAISLGGSNNNLIDNIINNNYMGGISLGGSNNNLINNTVSNSRDEGIYLSGSNNNLIGNIINNNGVEFCPLETGCYGGIYLEGSENQILNNNVKENLEGDITIPKTGTNCNNIIENNTGSGDRPIKYFNSSVNLENEVLSELILCNADNSNINNITVIGSDLLKNNDIIVINTSNSNFTNIVSLDNRYGIYFPRSNNNNFITKSIFKNNLYGIYSTGDNTFWNNGFINNDLNAIGLDSNWNLGNIGNYWSDFERNAGYPDFYLVRGYGRKVVDSYPLLELQLPVYLPLLYPIKDKEVQENENLIIQLNATGTNIIYSTDAANVLPSSFNFDSATGLFEWQPQNGDAGVYFVTFNVSDGNFWDYEIVKITVYTFEQPDCGDTLTKPTILTADILNCSGNGLIIGINDIALDCDGYIIDGNRTGYGIYLYEKNGITIKNCNIQEFGHGIYLYENSDNNLINNNVHHNIGKGIYLSYSTKNNFLRGNTVNNNDHGIYFGRYSHENGLAVNSITNNNYGLYLGYGSYNNDFVKNIADNNNDGVYFDGSGSNYLISNTMNNNQYSGIDFYGSYKNTFISNIINNNKNGIYSHPSLGIGHGNVLINNTINDNDRYGYFLKGSDNSVVNNTIKGNLRGIYLYSSSNNILANNIANNNNQYGIYLYSSSYNNLTNNVVDNNTNGIYLYSDSNNNFVNNSFKNNNYGTKLDFSQNNTFWNNFFVNNNVSAYEDVNSTNNTWNLTIGNYWSDFPSNPGYPNYYEIAGPGDGIDWLPIWPLATLYGRVLLRPRPANKNNTDSVNVTVKNLGTGIRTSYIVQSNYSGHFIINNIEPGNYNIWVKPKYFLAVRNDSVQLNPGDNNFDFGEVGFGDFNNDNKVDFFDIGSLSGAWDSGCGQAAYKWYVDANDDCKVDFFDLPPFSANYGSVGASLP